MDHPTDIGAVDTHAESIGRRQHRRRSGHKIFLGIIAFSDAHPGVIAADTGEGGELIHRLTGGGVDDGRSGCGGVENFFQLVQTHILSAFALDDLEVQIGSPESGGDQLHFRAAELNFYIRAHLRSGSRGERTDVPDVELFGDRSDPAVTGAEVVSPFADAVCFVNDQPGGRGIAEEIVKKIGLKPFRSDIEEFQFTVFGTADGFKLFLKGDGTVDEGCRNIFLPERCHLIRHQRNKRRDHQRVGVFQQSRKLIAERFPGSGGHNDTEAFSGRNTFHHRFLMIEESIKSEMTVEQLFENSFSIHLSTPHRNARKYLPLRC